MFIIKTPPNYTSTVGTKCYMTNEFLNNTTFFQNFRIFINVQFINQYKVNLKNNFAQVISCF